MIKGMLVSALCFCVKVLVGIDYAGLGFTELLVALQCVVEKEKGADGKDKPQKRQAIANIAR